MGVNNGHMAGGDLEGSREVWVLFVSWVIVHFGLGSMYEDRVSESMVE